MAHNKSPWQMPEGGLPAELIEKFWSKIEKRQGHWLWLGQTQTNGRPWLYDDFFAKTRAQGYVAAVRIAWALEYPGERIPEKLFQTRECSIKTCVNPACYTGKKSGGSVTPRDERLEKGSEGMTPVGGADANDDGVPRAIEALAAIQFGWKVPPRPLPKLIVKCPIESDVITTPRGRQEVKPSGPLERVPLSEVDYAEAPRDLHQLLDMIFQPDTVVITFRSGHVWFCNDKVRVDADSGYDALVAAHARMRDLRRRELAESAPR